MRNLLMALAAIYLMGCAAAIAKDKTSFQIYGAGTKSCGYWSNAGGGRSDMQLGQWLAGYITAYNLYGYAREDVLEDTDFDAALSWVDNYCKDHPLDRIDVAAQNLLIALMNRKNVPAERN